MAALLTSLSNQVIDRYLSVSELYPEYRNATFCHLELETCAKLRN